MKIGSNTENVLGILHGGDAALAEIGRASCRERVYVLV